MKYIRWLQDVSKADFLRSGGLYVTSDRLFLVRMRKNLLRFSIAQVETREVPLAKENTRKEALSEAIRSLLPHLDAVRDALHLCISFDQAIGAQLFLPQIAEENLTKVLEYEIGRQIPFRREEVYYDFLLTGRQRDKVSVFLFAVPKRSLDEILNPLASFGIKPRGVEITATALSNYVLFCTGAIENPALVLGGENGAWEMIGLNPRMDGWKQREPELIFAHSLPKTGWIQGPGREIFHDFVHHSPRLFGWGSTDDFFLPLQREAEPVEDLLALGRRRFGERKVEHPSFIPAIGAALRGLRETAFPVNLLPGSRERRAGKALSRLNGFLFGLLLVGLMGWGGSYPLKDEARLRQFQKENEKLAPAVQALQREEEELTRLRKEVIFLNDLRQRKGEILRILDELSRITPSAAFLSNLRYRDKVLELQGSAENASNLVPLLERSPLFENVGFNAPSNRGRDNRETFSLKAEVEKPRKQEARP
ncbi:MAG: PilN domain-containing protein [Deltaproteobacteria bacterium]|nr:PilN domain-containing protein [Deltaproteobacteria bacterium]